MPMAPAARSAAAPEWSLSSWQAKPALQMAEWEDEALAQGVLGKLERLPPLVQPAECDRLKRYLAEAGRGERFIVQGGDCAERFIDCEPERLEAQLRLLLQMGAVVEQVAGKPTVRIGRIAGQYGKPRSKPTEVVDGMEMMSFKGDNINGLEANAKDRKWDPERLLQGYFHSSATLNFLRSLVSCAEPSDCTAVDVDELRASRAAVEIAETARCIRSKASAASLEFFTAHEAMQLDLEQALTRKVGDRHYNLSAHLVWIGDRTRQVSGAHVEYFRGIANPVGVKIGPSMKGAELQELLQVLNPEREEGRVMLITRYGAGKVDGFLTEHIKAVQESGIPVVWQCDAVHGNGIVASNGYKTRRVEDCVQEVLECMAVHRRCGSVLGGLHMEVTGQTSVTECLGGCGSLTEEALARNYETSCDPRLNYSQAIEAAHTVATEMAAAEAAAAKGARNQTADQTTRLTWGALGA